MNANRKRFLIKKYSPEDGTINSEDKHLLYDKDYVVINSWHNAYCIGSLAKNYVDDLKDATDYDVLKLLSNANHGNYREEYLEEMVKKHLKELANENR